MNQNPVIYSSLLSKISSIIHGFSTKEWGNMSYTRDFDNSAIQNNNRFLSSLNIDSKTTLIINPRLAHSANIAWVQRRGLAYGYSDTSLASPHIVNFASFKGEDIGFDAVFTRDKKIVLTMRPADCAIVYVYHPPTQTIGLIHVGTVGVFNQIIVNSFTFLRIKLSLNSLEDLLIWISPSISGEAYDISKTMFWKKKLALTHSLEWAKSYELKDKIVGQLISQGVLRRNIDVSDHCTATEPHLFFSHHRCKTEEQRQQEGRMLAVLGFRP